MHNIRVHLLIITLCLSLSSWSQQAVNQSFQWTSQAGLTQPQCDLPQGFSFKETRRLQTPGGTHIHFVLQYHGSDIVGADAMLWLRPNNQPLAQITTNILGAWSQTIGQADLWFPLATGLVPVEIVDREYGPQPLMERLYVGQDGDTLLRLDLVKHLSDTTVQGFIYNPDPLTVAQTTYGGNYVDGNDMNLAVLNPLRDSVSFHGTYVPGQGYALSSPEVTIKELDAPIVNVPYSSDGTFYATRDQSLFEMVNAMYHIQKQKWHVDSLGYGAYVNYSIEVDVNAWSGADNSAFLPYTTPPRLLFGEGGVDDAEDMDVVLHEYGHALVNGGAAGSGVGTQRRLIEEAIGDYFAASASRRINPYGWQRVFSWDGHNPFWPGRMAVNQSQKMYPSSSFFSIYEHTDLFVDPLMRSWVDVGWNRMDALVLESIAGWTSNMDMPMAANLVLAADSALHNGAHASDLHLHFAMWQILTPEQSVEEHLGEEGGYRDYITPIGMFQWPESLHGVEAILFDVQGRPVSQWSALPHESHFDEAGIFWLRTDQALIKIQVLD